VVDYSRLPQFGITFMSLQLILASKAEGDLVVAIVGGVIGVVVLLLFVAYGSPHYDVINRGGAPYCPKCNRQVSYRREYCRCCGYKFVSYGASPEEAARVNEEKAKEARERRQRDASLQDRSRGIGLFPTRYGPSSSVWDLVSLLGFQ
jgi:hypothetical protein